MAAAHRARSNQIALAWLFAHLEENVAAAAIELSDDEFAALSAA